MEKYSEEWSGKLFKAFYNGSAASCKIKAPCWPFYACARRHPLMADDVRNVCFHEFGTDMDLHIINCFGSL